MKNCQTEKKNEKKKRKWFEKKLLLTISKIFQGQFWRLRTKNNQHEKKKIRERNEKGSRKSSFWQFPRSILKANEENIQNEKQNEKNTKKRKWKRKWQRKQEETEKKKRKWKKTRKKIKKKKKMKKDTKKNEKKRKGFEKNSSWQFPKSILKAKEEK